MEQPSLYYDCRGRRQNQWYGAFLRFKQGISRKVVISLKHLPEGILLNGSHARTIDLLREGDPRNEPAGQNRNCLLQIDVPRLYWHGMSPFSINLRYAGASVWRAHLRHAGQRICHPVRKRGQQRHLSGGKPY